MINKILLLLLLSFPLSLFSLPLGETLPRDDIYEKAYQTIDSRYENSFKQYFNNNEYFLNNLVDSVVTSNGEHFLDYWLNNYKKNKDCPSSVFRGHRDYLAYTYRLLYISLLEENLEESAIYYKKLTGQEIDVLSSLKSCKPKSEDMKKFLSRVRNYYFGKKLKLVSKLLPSEKKNLLSGDDNFIQTFICLKEFGCTEKYVKERLRVLIKETEGMITKYCEQALPLFNTSNDEVFFSLIYDSPALDVFESEQLKRSCLLKLAQGKSIERIQPSHGQFLSRLVSFKENYSYTNDNDESSTLGNIFNFGALRYFDSVGLGDLIFKEVKVAQLKKNIKVKEIVKIIKDISTKKEVIRKIKKVEKRIKAKEIRRRKISAFERAVFAFKARRIPVNVDMQKFELDYPEIKKDFLKIRSSLEKFQTRKSLDIMKRVDKLGSKYQPLPLKFLKFLIDFDYHQGLYNMVSVLGNDFYLINDIERKKSLIKINLINDLKTDFRWSMKILEVN